MRLRRIGEVLFIAMLSVMFWTGLAGGQGAPVAPVPGASFDLWQGIREVGFPAAAFVMLFWLVRTTLRENTQAINENTVALELLKGQMANCRAFPVAGRREDGL